MPFTGFVAQYAVSEIMAEIEKAGSTIVFVNTRFQAELLFQFLWEVNDDALPIAIFHASLTRELRAKTMKMMAEGKLRGLVATSAIELGIDWGDVDVVIQVGAPKGVSRLLQRIGRSNHQVRRAVEGLSRTGQSLRSSGMRGRDAGHQGAAPRWRSSPARLAGCRHSVHPQCCLFGASHAHQLHELVIQSWSYRQLTYEQFEELFQFVIDGGYVLRNYDRWQRLIKQDDGTWVPANKAVIQRHRQNIGVIIEAGKLKVKRRHGRGGKYLGEIEESFGQSLRPGDTFYFAGEILAFERIHDMTLEARASAAKEPMIPTYAGGQMPLSTFLAEGVRAFLQDEKGFEKLPKVVRNWLQLQSRFSILPDRKSLLVESFPRGKLSCVIFYTFEGRRANQTLGMLVSRRMERIGLNPLSFTVTDYGLAINSLQPVTEESVYDLLSPDILADELEEWLAESPMLKRSFRRVATIAGIVEQNNNSARKTLKQVTFSTDLIYDVLRKYEPNHVLLALARSDAERELLDLDRLTDMTLKFQRHIEFRDLPRPSPLSLPVILDVRTERLPGGGMEALLAQQSLTETAETLMHEVEDELKS